MKKLFLIFLVFISYNIFSQFDFYGPESFNDILDNSFSTSWTPSSLSSIENRKYIVILDDISQTNIISLNANNKQQVELSTISNITGNTASYGSVLRSIFQIVDENTHFENDPGGGSGTYTPLSGKYKLNPVLHSYYSINSYPLTNALNTTDNGSYYVSQQTNTGYLLVEFVGSSASTLIKAVEQWEYSSSLDTLVENTSWISKYLTTNGTSLEWTSNISNATNFFIADASDIIDLEILDGSDFNPNNVSFKTNATASIPTNISAMSNSPLFNLANNIDSYYVPQLDNSSSASVAASNTLDEIESTLTNNGSSLRYPKAFYLALRENILSHQISSSDIYNAELGYNTTEHVYFTNASDDNGIPHPFMVIGSHCLAARPNLLLDVNRPPGATPGAGYAQSEVTRHGKLGQFLVKIPLKNYGLVSTLLENDLSSFGDLASAYDAIQGSNTVKDEFNYAGTASIGMAVDGVTIYPSYNNNLRHTVEDAEITSSGIHVGGGLELHYHADAHAFNGNGINLYNISDYNSNDHPPVIGISYDGIALFGKHENSFLSMVGSQVSLDEYGGHDHGDGFGYHYHAHTQSAVGTVSPNNSFNQHILLVGAWKGNINNIPGFLEVKTSQLNDNTINRYVGVSYPGMGLISETNSKISIHPNPTNDNITISVKDFSGNIKTEVYDVIGNNLQISNETTISLIDYARGIYLLKVVYGDRVEEMKVIKH